MTADMTRKDPGIGAMLVSARSFEEYRAMFALSNDDLSRRVLDCPGGAASFVAVAGTRGVKAVAVDPVYAWDRGMLGEHALREAERGHAFLLEHAYRFVWTWFGDPADHARVRAEAARDFTADLAAHPERYIAGALPDLPFLDQSFDLVLSSHLLFTYGERLDEAFHLAALLELVRMTRWQVRLFPLLLHTTGERYAGLDRLRAQLAGGGVGSRLQRVDYEFQHGGNEMLVLERSDRLGRR